MNKAAKRVVVVLGMHRSGTSAVSRGLQVIGVGLGERLLPSKGDNRNGFWEDADINAINIEILSALKSDWHHLTAIGPIDVEILHKKRYFLRAVDLLQQKVGSVPVFGFKDPRVAKLLPFWKQVFSYCQFDVSYVLAMRHPLSVARSLAKRDGFDAEKSHLLWLGHVIASLAGSAGDKRVLIDYDRLLQSPDRELLRIAKCTRLEIDPAELQRYKAGFLDEGLRHTVYDLDDLLRDDTCPPIVHEVYAALLEVASEKTRIDDRALQNQVERWADELDRLKSPLRLVDRLYTGKMVVTQVVAERDGQIANLNQIVAERDRQLANLSQAVAERSGQIASLNQTVAESDGQIAGLNQTVAERDGQITGLNQTVAERDGQITGLNQTVAERDGKIAGLNQTVAERDRLIASFIQVRDALLASNSWRITAPLRSLVQLLRRIRFVVQVLPAVLKIGGGMRATLKKAWRVARTEGRHGVKDRLLLAGGYAPATLDYPEWIRRYDTLTDARRAAISRRIAKMQYRPLITVIMPVYNPPIELLDQAIWSVRHQLYPHWELCIADDASSNAEVHALLRHHVAADARIKVVFRTINRHVSRASNSALELATGEFVALLDHDDLLAVHALFWVAETINAHPAVGIIYSDEDKVDVAGNRSEPYFKCDWNPDLFLSQNMICHLGVYRADLVRQVGCFREGFEGSQDYDLALRCIEQLRIDQIVHIPRVLYYWRAFPGSAALAVDAKPYAMKAGERAINEHLARTGRKGRAFLQGFGYRVRYEVPSPPPRVSIIIPTHNGLTLIRECVGSILDKTDYPNYEILIVDNRSDDPAILAYFESMKRDKRIRVLRDERPFNFSALNNFAVGEADGDLVGLVNDDTKVITPEWLTEMVSLAIQPGVGAVGARLWYPDDTLQHAGVILGLGGVAGHGHKGLPRTDPGYSGRAVLLQTISAVTAACLVIRRDIYWQAGGMDEDNLQVAFNDVDFCLKVRELGYRNVWTPYAELYHHESATRGYDDNPVKQQRFQQEIEFMRKRWRGALENDPAYSPNLTLVRENFSIARYPRVEVLG